MLKEKVKDKEHVILLWQWIVNNYNYNKDFDSNMEIMIKSLTRLEQYEENTYNAYCNQFNRYDNSTNACWGCVIYNNNECCENIDSISTKWHKLRLAILNKSIIIWGTYDNITLNTTEKRKEAFKQVKELAKQMLDIVKKY